MPTLLYASDAGRLRRSWGPLVAWGTLLVALGIVVIALPRLTVGVALVLTGIVAVAAGLVWVSWAVTLRRVTGGWWPVSFLPGVLLLLLGAFALLRPEALADILFRFAGAVAVVWGLVDMTASWRLRSFFGGWWLRLLRGLLTVGAGAVVLFVPIAGIVAASVIAGVWFVAIGITTIVMGFLVHRLPKAGPTLTVGMQPDDSRPPTPLPPV